MHSAYWRRHVSQLSPDTSDGDAMFMVPAHMHARRDERCVTYAWLCNRPLFGEVYRRLMPEFFERMPRNSGVLIGSFVPSGDAIPGLTFPGDIDVLVIPYEGHDLLLSHVLAIEIKIVRASFARQGKSPNQYGFSQASALLDAGFPFAAVGHLIISDHSPESAWRSMHAATVVHADSGRCTPLQPCMYDMLPYDLMVRSHGRLQANRSNPLLGHFSACPISSGLWFPFAQATSRNPRASLKAMNHVHDYWEHNRSFFARTPRSPAVPPLRSRPAPGERLKVLGEKMRRDFSWGPKPKQS